MPRTRFLTSAKQVVPAELRRSPPRLVSLTASGWAAIAAAVVLTVGSVALAAFLYFRLAGEQEAAARLIRDGRDTVAAVTSVRRASGEDAQANLTYRYVVDGQEYTGRARLRKRDPRRNTVREGSRVDVRYLPARPSRSWIAGDQPRGAQPLIALALPAIAFPAAGFVIWWVRRQHRLLADGRVAMARVTQVVKRSGGSEAGWRVHYEWTLLSGVRRTGYKDRSRQVPPAGVFIPLLYDRAQPARNALYPLSLVRTRRS
jgi:hypothetical protein